MAKVWMRIGGWVSADKETMEKIMNGDETALMGAIKENGFALDGEAYIPSDDTGDSDFDIAPNKYSLKLA